MSSRAMTLQVYVHEHRQWIRLFCCLRQCELLRLFSWLLAIGFSLLVSQLLDLGLPCSQEDFAYQIPTYQPISE